MLASALALMSGAGHIHGKLGELSGLDEFQILFDAPFNSPEDTDPLGLKAHQGAAPDPSYNDSIHRITGKGFHGLALTVSVVRVGIVDSLVFSTRAVKNHKRRG
jgi:hypothetical protein